MSDYYEVQAAERRPGVVCLKPSKRLRQARVRRLSLLPLSLPVAAPTKKRPTPERREEEKTTDRANNAGPARQVQRTVACVGRGLHERESSPQVLGAGSGLFVLSVVDKISSEQRSVAQRKCNIGH